MNRNDDIAQAIAQRDIERIAALMFSNNPPMVKTNFRTESELWDYKNNCPKLGQDRINAWAELAVDVLAFHNHKGGVIIFGVNDDYTFTGATTRLDSKLVNDQLRRFISDRIWVEFHREYIQSDQRYLGIALIPPRGASIERFTSDAPIIEGKQRFKAGESAIREEDSSRVIHQEEVDQIVRKLSVPIINQTYCIDEPFFRILAPEYAQFIERKEPCKNVEIALNDVRSSVTAIIGIGGVGKTALATWAVLRAYEQKQFSFIVSITAKDRELTHTGIRALQPTLTSFESLLDSILDVLGFPEIKSQTTEKKEQEVRGLLERSNGLLYVDNLETVDDPRIVEFLDNLPVGTKAITTSRRARVRVSVHPIDLGPLASDEADNYIQSLATQPAFKHAVALTSAERRRVGLACDGIPLAIKWAMSHAKTAPEVLAIAERITATNKHGEELLEFLFRRVFEELPGAEKVVLEVLSLFNRPISTEALLVGADIPHSKLLDATEDLIESALVQRVFDPNLNDYCYTLFPIARTFIYAEVCKQQHRESQLRKKLADWFEARDVRDSNDRIVVREIRQGKSSAETALIDLAVGAERRGDVYGAQDLYQQAIQRNPKSYKALRLLAELYRNKLGNITEALQLYERAAVNSPRRGPERALIFREWGMILKNSGDPHATEQAVEKFEEAIKETPNDRIAVTALAQMYDRKGAYIRVIQLLGPLANHTDKKTRQYVLPLLLNAYERTGSIVKAAEIRQKLQIT